MAFHALADYQNHVIGWLQWEQSSLGDGAVVRFPRIWMSSGECRLKWILGTHANWGERWQNLLLTPAQGLEWQYHQHDPSVTHEGTFMVFDNGNNRAVPFEPQVPPTDNASRAVEFAVNADTMTVEQVWSYGDGDADPIYANFVSGAYRLPETGNVFVTFGGVITDPFGEHARTPNLSTHGRGDTYGTSEEGLRNGGEGHRRRRPGKLDGVPKRASARSAPVIGNVQATGAPVLSGQHHHELFVVDDRNDLERHNIVPLATPFGHS